MVWGEEAVRWLSVFKAAQSWLLVEEGLDEGSRETGSALGYRDAAGSSVARMVPS